jgi:hypothetical protein
MIGNPENIGDEPGRVIAFSDEKVVVDWGDDIPTEERPRELVIADSAEGENGLFLQPGSENAVISGEASPETETDVRAEIEEILSKTSIQDLLRRDPPRRSNRNAIVHIGTGLAGEILAKQPDGRILVRVAGEDLQLWPYEVRLENDTQGE